jgi:hypothetical protein
MEPGNLVPRHFLGIHIFAEKFSDIFAENFSDIFAEKFSDIF